ncbi:MULTISPECIES: M81 family metallopeptidase [unclassified Imperialibacter]|uniref:M81 family metallopeptidase n=1 Tax=unclassified Imperialibacter TaxID=2629706 RepID=UPI00125368FC|nr:MULTISPECIES: M81 family metallopeptidase [unclassified Imperialibacter]CAD5250828.1 Microcystin degradation protein MlrC [Imperialibacter sp. 89]CAD5283380.1 Microcystin degradation protein MlrC [Imperialibacter sp. 75]VVT10295.1 Microcystin degradation protein MlrC [Imperialibacter sp. EC-SDR9]
MKRISLCLLAASLLASSCSQQNKSDDTKPLPRIAIAGLAIESSTFSPALTDEEMFRARVGNDVFSFYSFLNPDSLYRKRANWIPTLRAHAIPGGAVTREAYESLVGKTLTMLKDSLPYDGLFFDIHGAMSVVGLDDPEGDFITRVREVVGYETIISTSMDLHGNVSKTLAQNGDVITCYRMAPHEDSRESDKRAVENLLERIESGKGKPAYKAWIPVPILLPGEKTSTRVDPGKSLYAKVAPAADQEGIVDAAIWIGYAWADEPRNHAVVMVTGDDKAKVTSTAESLANAFWEVRNEFEFIAPTATLEESLDMAIVSDKHPFMISDMGDNPTAGGAGDVTWTLAQILARPEFKSADGPSLIYASIPGPEFVEKAVAAGVGGKVSGTAGAAVDARFSPPIQLTGTVTAIETGDASAETEVVVKIGSVSVIVTKKRKPYHRESDFTNLGLNPRESDIVVVKIGYLVPELYDMRADWIMATTPGGVDQDLERLEFKRINRPMFPFDKDMEAPDLSAQLIPLSGSK